MEPPVHLDLKRDRGLTVGRLDSRYTGRDYDNAGVPMLTVTHGRRATRAHILAYTAILAVMAVGHVTESF